MELRIEIYLHNAVNDTHWYNHLDMKLCVTDRLKATQKCFMNYELFINFYFFVSSRHHNCIFNFYPQHSIFCCCFRFRFNSVVWLHLFIKLEETQFIAHKNKFLNQNTYSFFYFFFIKMSFLSILKFFLFEFQ